MLLSKLVRAIDHPYLKGKGGRLMNNKKIQVNNFKSLTKKLVLPNEMQGMDMKSFNHHVGIQPLFAITGIALTFISSFVSLVNCVLDNFSQGCVEVRLRPRHQLGQDQGLGGID